MENVIHRLTLDLTGPDTIPRVEVQQDNARSLSVSLTQGGRPYWIAEGVTAVFSGRKPDGKPLFNGCTIEKNRVRYDFTDQTTNVAGIVECEILLYSGDERILASPRFELAIDELIHKDGDVPESAPEISALTQMVAAGTAMLEDLAAALGELEGVEEIMTQARAAAEAASGSEAAAKGHAKTAADAAEDALTLAGQVNSACQQANKYAYEASQSAQSASVSQTAAENAAETAGDYARAAEESAKRAEAAAGNAGGGGTGDIDDAIDSHNTDLAAHPYFHERCDNLVNALGNKLDAAKLPEAINTALEQAQESGAFDGADGRGIASVTRTSGNGAAGTVDTYTITYTDGTTNTFNVRNGTNGKDGTDGDDGISPTVSVRAIDGGHQVTITDAQGAKTFDVMDGEDGRGIFSISRTAGDGSAGSTDIYTIKYTDNTTKQFAVQNGADGVTPHIGANGNWYIGDTDTGIKAQGEQGNAGRGIKSIARTSGNGAAGSQDTYTITYSDGTTSTFQVRNGANGKDGIDGTDGKDGADGKTPVKGTDYYTNADKAEMVQLVLAALPKWTGGPY